MEGEWSCYRGGHFNGGRIEGILLIFQFWRENGYATEVITLMEGKWSCYRWLVLLEREWLCYGGGRFNLWRMVILQKWAL